MTIEEAGQIILEGNMFCRCSHCNGRGQVTKGIVKAQSSMEVDMINYVVCTVCNGRGKMVKHEYRQACEMVDIPVPIPPKTIAATITTVLDGTMKKFI